MRVLWWVLGLRCKSRARLQGVLAPEVPRPPGSAKNSQRRPRLNSRGQLYQSPVGSVTDPRRAFEAGHRDGREVHVRSPWQNAYVERLIGSILRECLDYLIIIGEAHLRRVLRAYADYYNRTRTHLSLNKDTPLTRPILREGRIKSMPHLGGLPSHLVR